MKYKLTLSIGYSTAQQEMTITPKDLGYNQETWEALPKDEKEKELDDFLEGWMLDHLEYYWEEAEDDE